MIIDTRTVDDMALSLRDVSQHIPPNSIDSLIEMIDSLAMKAKAEIMGGVAVDPCIAVGLDKPDQVRPSQIFNDGEAAFVGKFSGIELVDFTPALERSPDLNTSLKPGDELITHGLVFTTDSSLEDLFEGNLGVASLMPYVAVLPGSLYRITRLTL
jgi:hypothetical protein